MPDKAVVTSAQRIGVIGMGVMGKNLALNMVDNGYPVSVFDLDAQRVAGAVAQAEQEFGCNSALQGCQSLEQLLSQLTSPRIVILSVPAGAPVDSVCHALLKAGLDAEDIVVDTGNSLWTDTIAREQHFQGKFHFFSSAVSGGEVGARFGPSLMPSGEMQVWQQLAPLWHAIAAKVDPETGLPVSRTAAGQTKAPALQQGEPCAAFIGPAGAGHYVKMVHNGIEYADMQLICEAYHLLSSALGMTAVEIAAVFDSWDKGPLNSYLMAISAEVLRQQDPVTGAALVDMILDKAGQKGTGLWTAVSSLELGTPAPTLAEAVYARALSARHELRQRLSQTLPVGRCDISGAAVSETDKTALISALESALLCGKIAGYAQGFQLMADNAATQGWQLNFADIARIWRAGCIIRAGFLQHIVAAYEAEPSLAHLFAAPEFNRLLTEHITGLRQSLVFGIQQGIPMPCLTSALSYYDSYRSARLPANLLQGQRDYFGAHSFERHDAPAGQHFHLNWSGDRQQHAVN
ncbi:6-phosphogluconate dehydrogenase, decarboxylating [Shewanella sp. NFH-SH190041]|uniref:NADP-dependent phosphogluconate dehydrogenase n=1 Tax=Shewanella sp. NFH-SH190041 TaxID=2950245 RepID=UPI0021C2D21E|nr:NADP-dependent phosphogluconate dehydrogenase [Shewanella sp. NFH-SH190041]BDM65143.1 6-phosphogluconate dehydrogenase, decarboxylating [Shewanella sp. NFH-SH190041]